MNQAGHAVTPESAKATVGPIAFHMYAAEFLAAAKSIRIEKRYSPVPYFLCCKAIELVLKAFLLAQGTPLEDLKKKYHHDLMRTLQGAEEAGLGHVAPVADAEKAELRKANSYCKPKWFEYFDNLELLMQAMKAYPDLPDLGVLTATATRF